MVEKILISTGNIPGVGPAGPEGPAGIGVGGYTVFLPWLQFPYSMGAWTPTVQGLSYFGGYYLSDNASPGTMAITHRVYMSAGTWNFNAYFYGGTNTGKYKVTVDGTDSADIDTYNGGGFIPDVEAIHTGLVIATTGLKTITITKLGTKHASSASYYVLHSGLTGAKVA